MRGRHHDIGGDAEKPCTPNASGIEEYPQLRPGLLQGFGEGHPLIGPENGRRRRLGCPKAGQKQQNRECR